MQESHSLIEAKPPLRSQPQSNQTYLSESLFSRMFFRWTSPFLELNRTKTFQQDMHPSLRPAEMSNTQYDILSVKWNEVKKRPELTHRLYLSIGQSQKPTQNYSC